MRSLLEAPLSGRHFRNETQNVLFSNLGKLGGSKRPENVILAGFAWEVGSGELHLRETRETEEVS